jgi:hypothetical protein
MASTFALSPIERQPVSRRRRNTTLFLAVLWIIVLAAEAAVVLAAPSFPDITAIYIATT